MAEEFSRGGFDAKAVAIYKQILRADDANLAARMALGDHFQRMGLKSDALRELQAALDLCQQRGLKREASELLKRLAALDPANVSNRLYLVDQLVREGHAAQAREEYSALLAELGQHTGADAVARVAEQALQAFPDHRAALMVLLGVRIAAGQAAEALELIERHGQHFAGDIELLECKVQACEALSDSALARATYTEMAEAYRRRGDADRARDILQRYCAVESLVDDPTNTSPSILLTDRAVSSGSGTGTGSARKAAPVTPPRKITPPPPPPQPPPAPRVAAEEQSFDLGAPVNFELSGTGSISDQLAEARVAFEFGDPGEAQRILRKILDVEPEHRQARELLARVRSAGGPRRAIDPPTETELETPEERELGRAEPREVPRPAVPPPSPAPTRGPEAAPAPAPAAAASVPASDEGPASLPDVEIVLQDEDDRDATYTMIDPPAELRGAAARLDPGDSRASLDEVDSEVEFELDLSADLDAPSLPDPVPVPMPSAAATDESVPPPASESSQSASASILEQLEEAEFFLEQGLLDEAERIYRQVLELAPNHPQALLRLGELESQRGHTPTGAAGPETLAAVPRAQEPDASLDELLSIPELELSGPQLAAPQTRDLPVAEAEHTSPSAPLVTGSPLIDPGLAAAEPPETEERPETESGPGEVFDLAAALEEELVAADGASGRDFEEVFRDFKRGVRQQLRDDDADAHYDLAIAYKEMGLVDDALRELDLVRRTGARAAETLWLMALCKRELGRPREAVQHLQAALDRVGDDLETRVSLLYDLGEALLAVGERASSLEAFKKVEAADAQFRDVRERIASLQ